MANGVGNELTFSVSSVSLLLFERFAIGPHVVRLVLLPVSSVEPTQAAHGILPYVSWRYDNSLTGREKSNVGLIGQVLRLCIKIKCHLHCPY